MSHQPFVTTRPRMAQFPSAPTRFSVDEPRHLVIVKFHGLVTAGEIAKYAKELLANSAFKPTFSEIVDLTEVTELQLQSDDFLRLADKIDPFWPAAKRAFVVHSTVQSHAARMHKILRTDRNIRIFQSLEEAEEWVMEDKTEEDY